MNQEKKKKSENMKKQRTNNLKNTLNYISTNDDNQ